MTEVEEDLEKIERYLEQAHLALTRAKRVLDAKKSKGPEVVAPVKKKRVLYRKVADDGTWYGHVLAFLTGAIGGVFIPLLLCCFPRLYRLSDNQLITLAFSVMVGFVVQCIYLLAILGLL